MAQQKQKQKKNIKKKFFPIESRITATKIQLYAGSEEELMGRVVTLDLTKSLRGKAFELRLKVKADKENLVAEPISLQLFQSYVRRVVRKGTDYAEDSFEVNSRDGVLRIKPLLVTRKRVSRLILNLLRENAKATIIAYAKIRDNKEIFADITTNKLQKTLVQKLKKIYPLALCEIRAIKLIKEVEPEEAEKPKKSEKKEQAKEEAEPQENKE